jgi:hypothetical protein
MSIPDVVQWAVTIGSLAFMTYIAFRKAQPERNNLNGGTLKSYAEAARIAGEGLERANLKIQEMEISNAQSTSEFERRLQYLENGASYEVTFKFTIGEFPTIGDVTIKPIVKVPEMKVAVPTVRRKKGV